MAICECTGTEVRSWSVKPQHRFCGISAPKSVTQFERIYAQEYVKSIKVLIKDVKMLKICKIIYYAIIIADQIICYWYLNFFPHPNNF